MALGNSESNTPIRPLRFKGRGGKLFEIYFVNILLRMITLNFYYPWAKIRELKFLYGHTQLFNSPLEFHGKGKELFLGYIKAIILMAIIYAPFIYALIEHDESLITWALVWLYLGILMLFPLAIHGTLKYRMAKTAWRGIRFGYRGELGILIRKCVVGFVLTILTLGIYGAWFRVDLRKYVFQNLRMGDVRFSFAGRGSDFFLIQLKGLFLIPLTLGIYSFWYIKEVFNFMTTNIRVHQNDRILKARGTATGMGFIELLVVNYFIVTFTFGLGWPWAMIRTLEYYFENLELEPGFNPETVTQTEKDYNDALAEDLSDMLDIALF